MALTNQLPNRPVDGQFYQFSKAAFDIFWGAPMSAMGHKRTNHFGLKFTVVRFGPKDIVQVGPLLWGSIIATDPFRTSPDQCPLLLQ
jgi:hypothetical protein